jgi:zinc transporter ZupT
MNLTKVGIGVVAILLGLGLAILLFPEGIVFLIPLVAFGLKYLGVPME